MKQSIDVSTLAGIGVALGCILGGNAIEGGHLGSILQVTAFMIVMGGTAGAVLVSFPMADVVGAMKAMKHVFYGSTHDLKGLIGEIAGFGQTARTRGLLALEAEIPKCSDPFLGRALRLAVDGTDPKILREVIEVELQTDEDIAKRHAKVFESAGGFSPTVGILGAVLGLIHVMENLTDPAKMGGGIATAFVATVYGVASANLFFLPAANKLKLKHEAEMVARTLMLEGVLAVQMGESPRFIEERLKGNLKAADREAMSESVAKAA